MANPEDLEHGEDAIWRTAVGAQIEAGGVVVWIRIFVLVVGGSPLGRSAGEKWRIGMFSIAQEDIYDER